MTNSTENSTEQVAGRKQSAMIQAVRLAFLVIILLITLLFQGAQPEFTSSEVLFPVYLLLSLSFAVNALFLLSFERAVRWVWPVAALFAFDAVFVTGIIYFTGISQSIFLFFYLINIILCGFVFLRRGALALALWTSILYSFLVLIGNEAHNQAFYVAFTLNLTAFFAVAVLSGHLSEQLNFAGKELKARRQDLADLTVLSNLIVENVATGLMTIGAQGEILRANFAALQILDREAGLLGRNINELFAFGSSQNQFVAHLERLLSAEEPIDKLHFDVNYTNRRNEKLTLEMIVSLLQKPSDQSSLNTVGGGYILIFQDLTKMRRLEFAVRQSEKLAAVGQLAAGIAHEIRNPLASISGSVQLLRSMMTHSGSGEQDRLMAIVLREFDRLDRLISEFLDFVRPESPEQSQININEVLREVAEMVKVNPNLRTDVEQILDLRSSQMVLGRFDKLKQALLNIIVNGYQAMEKAESARLWVSTYDRGRTVVVRVRDSGMGIAEANLKRIFEPFHTTKAKGTGLGLAITHKILESHSAKVFVESTEGIGTEFTLEFPGQAVQVIPSSQAALKKANE